MGHLRSDVTISPSCYGRIYFYFNKKIWKEVSCLSEVILNKPPRPSMFKFEVSELFVHGFWVILIGKQCEVMSYSDNDSESEDVDKERTDDKERMLSMFHLDFEKGMAYLVSTVLVRLMKAFLFLRQSNSCHSNYRYMDVCI